MSHDIDAIKKQWVGAEIERTEHVIDAQRLLDWATACGETDPRFTDPNHPDFQAHPTFTACLHAGPPIPRDFPRLGNGRGVDGGKAVVVHAPVRAGDTLVSRSELADVYTKTGRSGTMLFTVQRTTFTNQNGDDLTTVDWRLIQAMDDPEQ